MKVIFVSANDTGIMVNGVPFSTNVSIWEQSDFRGRFLADIVKDASTKTSVRNIETILSEIMGEQLTVSNYNEILGRLETLIESVSRDNETVLKNVLKTSSVGSNTKVSHATRAFWESGMASAKICVKETSIIRIGTPASLLDTLNKEHPTEYFPKTGGPSIEFDVTFTERLGFPFGLKWKCEATPEAGKFKVEISDTRFLNLVGEIKPGDKGPIFTPYSLGNEAKNKEINELYSLGNMLAEIYKHAAVKELADVAQVWMYLAYIYMVLVEIYGDEITAVIAAEIAAVIAAIKADTVMITTDRVVYLLCKILTLSCVYTGSREGVTSGGCTLKHFLAGPVDYNLKFRNILENCYRKVHGHNSSIIMGLRIMSLDFNNFQYFRWVNDKLRITSGAFQTKDNVLSIKALFAGEISKIQGYQSHIETIKTWYDSLSPNDFTDDAIVSQHYSDFCKAIEPFKCEQMITKRKTRDYLLNAGGLLTAIALTVGVAVVSDPNSVNIPNLENTVTANNGGMSLRKQVSKNRKVKGGGDYEYENSLGYYDYVFMNYVYKKYISSKYHYITPEIIKGNKELSAFYATLYDYCVNKYNDILIKLDAATYRPANLIDAAKLSADFANLYTDIKEVLLDKENDEDIILIGNKLSESIYFADDYYEEKEALGKELTRIYDETFVAERAREEAREAAKKAKGVKGDTYDKRMQKFLSQRQDVVAMLRKQARDKSLIKRREGMGMGMGMGMGPPLYTGGRKTKKRRKTKKNKK
jgi:hypothetical protein